MQGFFNYVNRQLCEYQSIFPNTAQLLDHILFTNGTGLHVDPYAGMIYEGYDQITFIHKYPDMSDEDWQELFQICQAKEIGFANRFLHDDTISPEELAANIAKYKRVSVDVSMFSEEYLYSTLLDTAQARIKDGDFVRPYPLSPGYANIFDLSAQTDKWFLLVAYNNCKAWERFLTEEIEQGHVWTGVGIDYADLQWTTKHRDLIAGEVLRLTKLLKI